MKWLILRGLVRERRHWGKFPELFEKELRTQDPLAEVHGLDSPGFGTEAARISPNTISEIVRDLRERWLQMKSDPNETWNVLAISLGGMSALQWCSQYPDDFKNIVLVNSSVSDFSPVHKRMKPKNYLSILSLLLKPEIEAREKKILSLTTRLQGAALAARAKENASFALPVRRVDAVSQITAAIRFRAPQSIASPMLVLVSTRDELVDASCSHEIAKHYGAELHEHPTANHDMPEDDPLWIATQVNEWISKKS
jgi:pimeloyl-ACP methyl ester carboxylesterase